MSLAARLRPRPARPRQAGPPCQAHRHTIHTQAALRYTAAAAPHPHPEATPCAPSTQQAEAQAVAKQYVLTCETARFGLQNAPFYIPKRPPPLKDTRTAKPPPRRLRLLAAHSHAQKKHPYTMHKSGPCLSNCICKIKKLAQQGTHFGKIKSYCHKTNQIN